MAKKIGVFSEGDANRIAETVRRWGPKIPGTSGSRSRGDQQFLNLPVKIVAPSGGIPAMIGDAYGGPVTCQVVVKNASGDQTDVSGYTIEVYSYMTVVTAATGDRRGHAMKFSDGWFIVGEDCQNLADFNSDFNNDFAHTSF